MEEQGADNVQCEADTSQDQNQLRLLNSLQRYESLDGLEEDANAQSKQENTIEEGSE